jgi:hypothetical protein
MTGSSQCYGVGSLDKARAFLEENYILGSFTAKELFINPVRIQGLDTGLVEG